MLLNHLSTANAAKYGVSIQAEAVPRPRSIRTVTFQVGLGARL
jgi:hypothetical protein